jgi:hypothetical protein
LTGRTIGPASQLKHKEGILKQAAAGTCVLLRLEDGEYYSLNELGSRVWELCDGTRRVADTVAILAQEYDAPAEAIQSDVLELLTELADEKLVEQSA